jgi:hypothetical protein
VIEWRCWKFSATTAITRASGRTSVDVL